MIYIFQKEIGTGLLCVLGWIVCPPKNSFISQNIRTWPYLKWGHCRHNELRWGHTGVGWILNSIRLVCFYEDSMWRQDIHRGEIMWREKTAMWSWRQRLEWCAYKPRNAKDWWHHQKLRERQGTDSSLGSSERTRPSNTWILNYQLQNCERLHFCCFKPFNLWYFCYNSHRKQVYHVSLCTFTKWEKGLFLQEHLVICSNRFYNQILPL